MDLSNEVSVTISISAIVISLASSLYSYFTWKRTSYVKSVTNLRAKWLANLKDDISEFCGIAYGYSLAGNITPEKLEKFDKLRFLIPLNLNPTDKFDDKIIEKLKDIPDLTDYTKHKELSEKIKELVKLCQKRVKHDWEVVKLEARTGKLSDCDQENLKNKYLSDV